MPSGEHCNRILEETLYAVALPSLGALAEGHILVVPKEHWCSLASIPLNTLKQLNCVRNRMLNRLCVEYGPVLQFEHGVVNGQGGGCGISHAHLHMVPVSLQKKLSSLLPLRMKPFAIQSLMFLPEVVPQNTPYLYIEESNGQAYVYFVDDLPSQFIRKLICDATGSEDWDWRAFPFNRSFERTLKRLQAESARTEYASH
jgi:diadenosine tetraphosphate (Ap4A) HIT family hydrolase